MRSRQSTSLGVGVKPASPAIYWASPRWACHSYMRAVPASPSAASFPATHGTFEVRAWGLLTARGVSGGGQACCWGLAKIRGREYA